MVASLAVVLTMLSPLAMSGCSKKKEEAKPVAVRPPPPPPPAPEPVQLDRIRASLDVDARVQFPQEQAPVDEELARAVFTLASALANLDAARMQPLMTNQGRAVLAAVSSEWFDVQVEGVRIVFMSASAKTTRDARDALVVTAIADNTGDPMVLVWNATRAGSAQWLFNPAPATDATRATLASWDNLGPFEYEGLSLAARFPEPQADDGGVGLLEPGADAPAGSSPRPRRPGQRTPTGIVPIPDSNPGG